MVDLDGRISVLSANTPQTAYKILSAAGYTGSPIASQFIMTGDKDARVGRNANVDATHGAVLPADTPLNLFNVDLNAFRIYVAADTVFDVFVTGRF